MTGIIGAAMEAPTLPTSYIFRMDCWKPTTLPAKRLAEYLAKLAALFGSEEHVHFLRVRSGSTKQLLAVDAAAAEPVYLRLIGAGTAAGDATSIAVRNEINRMLIDDGGVGTLRTSKGAKIIDFLGRKTPISEEVTIHEAGELVGRVVRVGGRGKNDREIPVTIAGQDFYPCVAPKELAKRLAACLFEGEVRAVGNGRWTRGMDGAWRLRSFDIKDFSGVEADQSLTAFVAEMRAVAGSGWNAVDDAQAELRKMRED